MAWNTPAGGQKVRGQVKANNGVKQQRMRTHPADEALRVPQTVQSRDVVFQDGPGTATTFWSKHVEVVLSAVGLSILLVET